MVALQIISKILESRSISIVENNNLTKDYFVGYEDEFEYLQSHYNKYSNVPDKETFLSKFPEFELVDVQESDRYLVDTIKEEYLYYKSVPVVQKVADLLKTDSNAAAEYMINAVKELQPNYQLSSVDIISESTTRFNHYKDRKENVENWYFTSGFKELDELIHGLQRGEEFVLLFARINQGKSWVLEKMCTHVWQLGFNVGYMSPEMSADSVGYRFDTLYKNFSNRGLSWGKDSVEDSEYQEYIENLKTKKNKFMVSSPNDFDGVITVSKLKNWVKQYSLDVLAIDGLTYLTDERSSRNDTEAKALTHISEDLMSLSLELKIPVLVVVQANRSGVREEDDQATPELENIKDSDGMAANASKVISIRQLKDQRLVLQIKKQRNGPVGGKLVYEWDIDKGDFNFVPTTGTETVGERRERQSATRNRKKQEQDKTDVF